MDHPQCHRLILYTRRMDEMTAFYHRHFGYTAFRNEADRIVELRPAGGGAILMLHPAAKGQREGQAQVKLVFDVRDVAAFRDSLIADGLPVGPLHDGGGYVFANLKDPSGNSLSISGRGFASGA